MMGRLEPGQERLFYNFRLEDQIPPTHLGLDRGFAAPLIAPTRHGIRRNVRSIRMTR